MLYFKIKNYEEFKENFGMRNNTRKNNILLSYLKHEMRSGRPVPELNDLVDMYNHIMTSIHQEEESDLNLMGFHFKSEIYKTDDHEGLCKDGDTRQIRYIRKEDGRVFKMKAGKFLRKILMEEERTKDICEQAIIYICETFASTWMAFASSKKKDEYILVVDDDFESIYNSDNQAGGFNSCMNDKGFYDFYSHCVDAKAASLWDDYGEMLARCIIFTEVHEQGSSKVYRLAERQYAKYEDNSLKQILVNMLIDAGEIDGYKKVGASCHDPSMFLLNDGTSLSSSTLYINSCNVINYEVPYMDSFKYYNEDNLTFYNSKSESYTHTAECNDGNMDRVGEYDEYHDYYCEEVRAVYAWRRGSYSEVTCDVNNLEDFEYCERYYDYYTDTVYSSYHSDYIPRGKYEYSNHLDDYLWVDECCWCDEMNDFLPTERYEEILAEYLAENEIEEPVAV